MKIKFSLVIAAFVALASLTACGGASEGAGSGPNVVYSGNPAALVKNDTTLGTGAEGVAGKWVKVTYAGFLYNEPAADKKGSKFDAGTFAFKLGAGSVIPGFDQGVTGMKVGGKRTVMIPSSLGYGATGSGYSIPPNAGLVFEVELLQVSDTQIQ